MTTDRIKVLSTRLLDQTETEFSQKVSRALRRLRKNRKLEAGMSLNQVFVIVVSASGFSADVYALTGERTTEEPAEHVMCESAGGLILTLCELRTKAHRARRQRALKTSV